MKSLALTVFLLLTLQGAPPVFGSALAQPAKIQVLTASSARSFSQSPTSAPDASAQVTSSQSSEKKVTAYTLPPDLYRKARDLGRFHARFAWIDFFYGIFVLWVILYWRF